jgi:hypothetical protein
VAIQYDSLAAGKPGYAASVLHQKPLELNMRKTGLSRRILPRFKRAW